MDRRTLPDPDWDAVAHAGYLAPRTDGERTLAGIWAELLGVSPIGVEDNFFELGGDSIVSIQVASRARQAGLHLMPRDLFAHPTIAALAASAAPTAPAPAPDQEPVTGDVPLTPIQRWFFETQTTHPEHFNQSVQVKLADPTDETALRRALDALVVHHDALRMRYVREDGHWRQEIVPPSDVDILGADAGAGAFDLSTGPLLRASLGGDGVLTLTAHHLVVDGVSWRILLEDLATAYQQAARGERIDLGAKTTSLRDWAHQLTGYAAAGGFDDELSHWAAVTEGGDPVLPLDGDGARERDGSEGPVCGQDVVGTMRSVTARLDRDRTAALLHQVPAVYRTQINDVLLAALGRVLSRWTGRDRVLVDLEGHGREDLLDGLDLSRTVGWFTTMFPVALQASPGDWGEALKSTKEQLRTVPRNGLGYGALRYLTGALESAVTPQVSFNYLGQFQHSGGLHSDVSPQTVRPHLLDIVGAVVGDSLELTWFYSTGRHDESTIRRLAGELIQALREIVEHCAQPGTGGRTPSDFPLARLDQRTVDQLVGDGRSVEDIYPLTPMQAGMVFHSLVDASYAARAASGEPPASSAYLNQVRLRLSGVSDPRALGAAWQRVVDATPVLRTRVVWEGVDQPLQVVQREVTAAGRATDWPACPMSDDRARYSPRDRAAGLDLGRAPLMRLAIVTPAGE